MFAPVVADSRISAAAAAADAATTDRSRVRHETD